MKYLLAVIFSLTLVCASPQLVYSAFWRHHAVSRITTADTGSDSTRRPRNNQIPAHERKKGIPKKHVTDDGYSQSGFYSIASLVCGVLGFSFFTAIPAIILGVIGLRKDRKFRWMSIAGICLGAFFILFYAAVVVYMIYFF